VRLDQHTVVLRAPGGRHREVVIELADLGPP
jgi:hypothetical protein